MLEIPQAGPECPAKVGTEKYAGEGWHVGGSECRGQDQPSEETSIQGGIKGRLDVPGADTEQGVRSLGNNAGRESTELEKSRAYLDNGGFVPLG